LDFVEAEGCSGVAASGSFFTGQRRDYHYRSVGGRQPKADAS
jgi:hypothetical protein